MRRFRVWGGLVALTLAVAMACGESSNNRGSESSAGQGGDADSTDVGAPAGGSRADGGQVGGGNAGGGMAGSLAGLGGAGAESTVGDGGALLVGGAGDGGRGGDPDSSGAAGAGGAEEGGAGGDGPILTSCEAAPPKLLPSCSAQSTPEGNTFCRECLKSQCCEAWQACYGTGPRNACGYGEQVGDAIGESDCILLCWYETYDGSQSDDEVISACADKCATCSDTLVSEPTTELISCALDECADSCFPMDF